uniref:Transcription elongation regulator 1 n=1 Tax=Panagrellus redivivus TaxID=6233 RepID=A0A7E4VE57_PANRE
MEHMDTDMPDASSPQSNGGGFNGQALQNVTPPEASPDNQGELSAPAAAPAPKRRTRFEEAPEEVKMHLPPPGRFSGAPPMGLRPPGLMQPPGMRPRPLMDEEPMSFFNQPPRGFPHHNGAGFPPPRGPRPRPGLGFQQGPPPRFPPRFPGNAAPQFRPQVNQQEKLKQWLELAEVKDEVWVETKTADGKSYYYNAVSRVTVWTEPKGDNQRIVDQAGLQQLVDIGMKVEREKNPPAAVATPSPAFPGYPGMPPRMPLAQPSDADKAWQEFKAPDGRNYYYNHVTQENTWEKPKAMIQHEANPPMPNPMIPTSLMSVGPAGGFNPQAAAMAAAAAAAAAAAVRPQGTGANAAPISLMAAGNFGASPGPGAAGGGGGDGGRPVSSSPVSGTPWCIVWTGDGRVFFYNPTTKTSVWQRPPELYNRKDVDLLVAKRPETKEGASPIDLNKPMKKEAPYDAVSDDDEDGSDDDVKAPPRKKTRQEKKQDRIEEQKRAAQQEKKERAKPKEPKEIDPAIQAEIEAKEKRAQVPFEERRQQFLELLKEKGVSANSTFQKELSKIVFDPRYLLLGCQERKDAFDDYSKERAEAERAEKKARAKVAKEQYLELLKDAGLDGKSSFSSFVNKFGKDERFKAVEKNRDREDFFKDFVDDLYQKEKEEKKRAKEEARENFKVLLSETKSIKRRSKWSHIKKKIDSDPRYKAKGLDSSLREDIFRDYISSLPDEDDRSDDEGAIKDEPKTAEELAIERRKEEVASELSEQKKERVKEREMLQYHQEVDEFNVILKDLIKQFDLSWHDARKILKKDSRYKDLEVLSKDEKEDIFKQHIDGLKKRRREAFFQLLSEDERFDPNTRWKEAKKILFDDEKYAKVILSEHRTEDDFRDWRKVHLNALLKEFRLLLRETKIITYESKKKILINESHLSDILAVLENDKRYLVLKGCPEERERELEKYIDDLDAKGPPPPPTAPTDVVERD